MRRGVLWATFGGVGLVLASAMFERGGLLAGTASSAASSEASLPAVVARAPSPPESRAASPPAPPLAGLDLTRIALGEGFATARVEAGTAELTLDVGLQKTAAALMRARRVPQAAVVLMDVASGRILVYASHTEGGPARDLCAEATAPSASVFKIVTASALVEDAHLGPDTRQCYLGGEHRIDAVDLVDDPRRDRWCTTLAGAMGRSINAVFARLAGEHLSPELLEAMARKFGFGEAVPFDVPVQPSAIHVPQDPLEFARTAAGFWNSTLSPIEAAEMSAIVARGGEGVRPRIVERVVDASGAPIWSAADGPAMSRVIASDTAQKVTEMMEHTVNEGTSFRAFHDPRGGPSLPGIGVAGKTGTLTGGQSRRYYTWFTGFAPVKPTPDASQVAVAVLVVNGPSWQIKANALARDVLRAYFASRGIEGVSAPLSSDRRADVQPRPRAVGGASRSRVR
jgi:cell division protein FtsI/penicillin-binding protein 2